jgi:hypothetical protein
MASCGAEIPYSGEKAIRRALLLVGEVERKSTSANRLVFMFYTMNREDQFMLGKQGKATLVYSTV